MTRKGRRKNRAKYILFDGFLDENSWVRISCPHCRTMYHLGITTEKNDKVDTEPINPIELLKSIGAPKEKDAK